MFCCYFPLILYCTLASLNGKPILLLCLQKGGLCETCCKSASSCNMHLSCVVRLKNEATSNAKVCAFTTCVQICLSKLTFENLVCLVKRYSLSEVAFQQGSFQDCSPCGHAVCLKPSSFPVLSASCISSVLSRNVYSKPETPSLYWKACVTAKTQQSSPH